MLVTLGKVRYHIIHMINFFIVNHLGAYNIILGRLFLTKTNITISIYYPAMNILTANKVITIKEDQ